MTEGAVAAGSPLTVAAGLSALRAGGNAVDAAIAASLMACVAEPLLTGLGGAGIAILRMNGVVEVCDMFSNAPGLGQQGGESTLSMDTIQLDFGPTTQRFHVGTASVAVPGLPLGLWALHQRYARLPMTQLAAPAIEAAANGYEVPIGFERVGRLLWPIQQLSAETAQMFGDQGRDYWRAGQVFRCANLSQTIANFASEGPGYFRDGAMAQAIIRAVSPHTRLTLEDLASYEPRFTQPLGCSYRDLDIWVPGPPSVAGLLVLQALRSLEDNGPMPDRLSAQEVVRIAAAMERVESTRTTAFMENIFQDGFVDGFMDALSRKQVSAGHTTHISVVDEDGNVVGITSSLGETAGVCVPGTGLVLNNFLGEEDVNPPQVPRGPGQRLFTMCCPTIASRNQDQVYVMGSGGSSRIRSAVLHGIVYLADHAMTAPQMVQAPRAHVEFGHLHVEADGRPSGAMESLAAHSPMPLKRFDGPNMFFGGLHVAGSQGKQFVGAGDPRRSGRFDFT